uniref:Uncharacterized protein n=1 Tax=Megaselia scalaris TaxID=36166 RepID=T1GH24_MEGSC
MEKLRRKTILEMRLVRENTRMRKITFAMIRPSLSLITFRVKLHKTVRRIRRMIGVKNVKSILRLLVFQPNVLAIVEGATSITATSTTTGAIDHKTTGTNTIGTATTIIAGPKRTHNP